MLKKLMITLVGILAAAVLLAVLLLRQPSAPASQAFINGNVLTMNAGNTVSEAVLIEGRHIVAVGSNALIRQQINSDTVVHDLRGKTLIPGFIDAHGHFPGSSLAKLNVDLNSPPIGVIKDIDGLIGALQQKAATTGRGEWILGVSYDDTSLAEHRHPTRAELDRALPDHPVFLWHISGHMGVANSAALRAAGIDESTPNPDGGVYVKDPLSGQLTGLLEENATMVIQAMAMDFSVFDFLKMTRHAAAEYAAAGVTTAQSGATARQMARGLQLASTLGMVPMRLELWPLFDDFGPQLLDGSVDAATLESATISVGAIKIIADGSIQGYTGYLSKPYHQPFHGDEDYRGYPRIPKSTLNQWVQQYHAAGHQLAIHGNGDAAIDDILQAIELAQQAHPRADSRHIIVHAQMARDDQLDKMKTLGVSPSFFVAHTYYWGDRHREIFMGPKRAARMSPTASALARQLPFTIHLDTPVVPMDPLFLVWTAVNRISSSGQVIGSAERIDTLAALRAVTIDAAWQIFQEHNRGSIETGKYADLVVLSDNPVARPETVKDISVELTMVGGRIIFASEAFSTETSATETLSTETFPIETRKSADRQ